MRSFTYPIKIPSTVYVKKMGKMEKNRKFLLWHAFQAMQKLLHFNIAYQTLPEA